MSLGWTWSEDHKLNIYRASNLLCATVARRAKCQLSFPQFCCCLFCWSTNDLWELAGELHLDLAKLDVLWAPTDSTVSGPLYLFAHRLTYSPLEVAGGGAVLPRPAVGPALGLHLYWKLHRRRYCRLCAVKLCPGRKLFQLGLLVRRETIFFNCNLFMKIVDEVIKLREGKKLKKWCRAAFVEGER